MQVPVPKAFIGDRIKGHFKRLANSVEMPPAAGTQENSH